MASSPRPDRPVESEAGQSERLLELVGKPGGPLADAAIWPLEVTAVAELTPTMRRIEFTAPGIAELNYRAGQDLMFRIPLDGGALTNRRYTIRDLDRARAAVTCDILVHGHGPGARWAAATQPGDHVDAIGPRGKVWPEPADWHWFLGDESAVPATLAMIEALPAGATARALLDVASPDEEQAFLREPSADVQVKWLHRGDSPPAGALATAIAGHSLPPGSGHVYLNGEAHEMRELRAQFLELGLADEQVTAKSYWTHGRANGDHGEPLRDEA